MSAQVRVWSFVAIDTEFGNPNIATIINGDFEKGFSLLKKATEAFQERHSKWMKTKFNVDRPVELFDWSKIKRNLSREKKSECSDDDHFHVVATPHELHLDVKISSKKRKTTSELSQQPTNKKK